MSLAGQWISDYQGTNKGTLIVDVEDRGDRYHGIACAWDSKPTLPSSLVRFVTESKSAEPNVKASQNSSNCCWTDTLS